MRGLLEPVHMVHHLRSAQQRSTGKSQDSFTFSPDCFTTRSVQASRQPCCETLYACCAQTSIRREMKSRSLELRQNSVVWLCTLEGQLGHRGACLGEMRLVRRDTHRRIHEYMCHIYNNSMDEDEDEGSHPFAVNQQPMHLHSGV